MVKAKKIRIAASICNIIFFSLFLCERSRLVGVQECKKGSIKSIVRSRIESWKVVKVVVVVADLSGAWRACYKELSIRRSEVL